MKRIFSLIILILIILGVFVIWQKERILGYFHPTVILMPYYKQPDVYDLLVMLEKNGIDVVSPPIVIDKTIQATISGVTIYFATDKDFFTQVRSLQLVLPKAKMDGKNITTIDLRFSKVVLRY